MRPFTKLIRYIQWVRTWKQLPVRAWVEASDYFQQGRYGEAAARYKRGLERHPEHPASHAARLDLAYCFFRSGDLQAAERELKLAVQHRPDSREASVRLAQLQSWAGATIDAVWTLKRINKEIPGDAELIAELLLAQLERKAPVSVLKEIIESADELEIDVLSRGGHLLAVAQAKFDLAHGDFYRARSELLRLAQDRETSVEAIMALSEFLLSDGQHAFARQQLRRALAMSCHNPKVYSLLAESYLASGLGYNPEFGRQLALSACQLSSWHNPRYMHLLAEAYMHSGDRMGALLMASRAKGALNRPLVTYPKVRDLDKMIQELASSTIN